MERALSQGPAQIIEQIEPLESLRRLLSRNEDAAERERQKQLRAQAEAALRRKYGEHPAPGIVQRFNWELERFEQLGMAGQVLLMQEIVQTAHEAGGRVSIAGTWNSSFLLSLLEITELNPLPPELDPNGFDLCPVALLGTKEGLLSADLRLPGEVIPLVRERAAKQHGNQLLQIQRMVRAPRAEDEINALIEQYLTDCCSKETAEALREDGAFYYAVRGHSGRMEMAPVLSSLHLLPETADPSALPIAPDTPEYGLRMASFGPNQLDHIPSVLLIGSSAQSVLMRCAASTSVPFQGIPLDGESVYMTLGEAYRTGDMETPVAAACDLLGVRVNEFDMELYRAMGVVDLHSLIRFMNLAHSTGAWQGQSADPAPGRDALSGAADHLPGGCLQVFAGARRIPIGGVGFYGVCLAGESRPYRVFRGPAGAATEVQGRNVVHPSLSKYRLSVSGEPFRRICRVPGPPYLVYSKQAGNRCYRFRRASRLYRIRFAPVSIFWLMIMRHNKEHGVSAKRTVESGVLLAFRFLC